MFPRVTVLMPVHNGEKYLREAIESILMQSYSDFEFLIINDGSTDKSVEIIKSFSDKRIRLENNEINIGQANSLNKGIGLARGEYIVRMDADDISLPDRIKKQVEFMDKNPEIGISGTWVKFIGDIEEEIWRPPTNSDTTMYSILFYSAIVHPSSIFRKKSLELNNLYYRPEYESSEDYDLWARASMHFPISNLGEVLLFYRIHEKQVSNISSIRQSKLSALVQKDLLENLNIFPTQEEHIIHRMICKNQKCSTKDDLLEEKSWLENLNKNNDIIKLYDNNKFTDFIAQKWLEVCYKATHFGLWTYKIYISTKMSRMNKISLRTKLVFIFRCAVRYNHLN